MKAKDFKLKINDLDDEIEITAQLAADISKPEWTKGEIIWDPCEYNEEEKDVEKLQIPHETISEAWLRLFGEKRNRQFEIDSYQGLGVLYFLYPGGKVLKMEFGDFSIQLDPTYKEQSNGTT